MFPIFRRWLFPRLAVLGGLAWSCSLFGFTKSGTIYSTDGSQTDVNAAIANASAGDTVSVPQGSFTWGDSGSYVALNKSVTLQGAGIDKTIINLSSTGSTFTTGTIRIQSAAAVVRDFTILPPASGNKTTPFSVSGSGYIGWRITNVKYDCTGSTLFSYFVYVGKNYGLIDHCVIIGGGGSNELIFARGPDDSWQTPTSIGTQNALFIEDNIFSGQGYLTDINDNGRAVVRYNTVNSQMKIDGHGYASNSKRGVRHMEAYGNHWTAAASSWAAFDLRGGTGMIFDNLSDNRGGSSVFWPNMYLVDYGSLNLWSNFGNVYQTPVNYPIKDQVGVGMDPKVPGSEPMYLWNNIAGGVDWKLSWKAIPAGAISLYQTQTTDVTSTFTMQDIIKADRDYFKQTVGATFNGASGVGRGTKAQMLAITPTKTGVGFWVTDEGSWNTTLPANTSGRFYLWSGSSWVLKYIPYTYPHPLQGGTPTKIPPSNAKVTPKVQ